MYIAQVITWYLDRISVTAQAITVIEKKVSGNIQAQYLESDGYLLAVYVETIYTVLFWEESITDMDDVKVVRIIRKS